MCVCVCMNHLNQFHQAAQRNYNIAEAHKYGKLLMKIIHIMSGHRTSPV